MNYDYEIEKYLHPENFERSEDEEFEEEGGEQNDRYNN